MYARGSTSVGPVAGPEAEAPASGVRVLDFAVPEDLAPDFEVPDFFAPVFAASLMPRLCRRRRTVSRAGGVEVRAAPAPLPAKRGPHRAIAGLFGIGNRIFGVLASTAEIQLSFAETPVSALGVESRWCREAVESGAGGVEVRAASGPGIARGGARLWVASTITRTARPTGGRRPCMTAEEAR